MREKLLSAVAVAALIMGGAIAQSQAAQSGHAGTMQQGGDTAAQDAAGTDATVCPPEKCPQGMQKGQTQMQQQGGEQGQATTQKPAKGQGQGAATNEASGNNTGVNPATGKKRPLQTGQKQNQKEPTTTGSTRPTADINEEQRTQLRTSLREVHVKPVAHVDFDINIGVEVPRTVVLHPLPRRIVEIVPAYAGYEFFELADGTIIIVDPGTFQIVYVLTA